MTDTDGRLLTVEVHAADIQDRDGAKGVLKRSRRSARPIVSYVTTRDTIFLRGAEAPISRVQGMAALLGRGAA